MAKGPWLFALLPRYWRNAVSGLQAVPITEISRIIGGIAADL
jgi:hypothetical protein